MLTPNFWAALRIRASVVLTSQHLLKHFTLNYFQFQNLNSFKADGKLPLQIKHAAPIIF